MATYAQVTENYAKNTGFYRQYPDSRMFYEGDILYSYGHHFPLAIRLGDEKDRLGRRPPKNKTGWGQDARGLFLKNGDKYSNTTSGHQGHVQHYCHGPTVSFNALLAAGIPAMNYPTSIKRDILVTFTEDTSKLVIREKETGQLYERSDNGAFVKWSRPRQGMFISDIRDLPEGYLREKWTPGHWHLLGGALLNWEGSQWLCGMDDDSYFVSKLAGRHRTIADAYAGLKPKQVRQAEKDGKTIHRQGEWYFIETGMSDRDFADMVGCRVKDLNGCMAHPGAKRRAFEHPLPRSSDSSNPHRVRHMQYGNRVYAKGRVRHPEHPMVLLGQQWHQVYKNTEEISFSFKGNVD
jgi:hypothetical protein